MYIKRYKVEEEFVFVNRYDDDLIPIKLKVPDIPNDNLIHNFGLPNSKQKYFRSQMPARLTQLAKRVWKDILGSKDKIFNDEMNREIFRHRDKYQDIHLWIEKEWRRRLYGDWYFINGKRVYVPGSMIFFNDYWHLNQGLPEYKEKDRVYFFFLEQAIKNDNCYGIIEVTKRRDGKSVRASCALYDDVTRVVNAHGGIQSKNDLDAKQFYEEHLKYAWKKIPFYFQPLHEYMNRDPGKAMLFSTSIGQGMEQLELGSSIDYRPAKPLAYDGSRLRFYISDEEGKLELHDCYERWSKVKPTLRDHRGRIIGKSIHTTTVEDSGQHGLQNFHSLWKDSSYHERNEYGQTKSGLWRIFQPAYDGIIVDDFGYSDLEAGKAFLNAQRNQLGKNSKTYIEEVRKNPFNTKEAFIITSENCPFDRDILQKRIDVFFNDNPYVRRGNFIWKDNIPDGEVVFVESESGRFYVSHFPNKDIRSAYGRKGSIKYPLNTDMFVAGGDTFNFDKVEHGTGSMGGGAVFMMLDPTTEYRMQDIPDGMSQEELDQYTLKYKTHRFVCTYCYRPDGGKAEYIEDMIKMCVFYGCQMFPEMNHTHIQDGFKARGYDAYLLHMYDEKRGKFKSNSGDVTNDNTKDRLFTYMEEYILQHGQYEFHDDLLRQCLKTSYSTMTDNDLFSASAYALYGASLSRYRIENIRKKLERGNTKVTQTWFQEYTLN